METKGRLGGAVAFVVALIPAGLFIITLAVSIPQAAENVVLWALPTCGIIAMLLSNYIVDKFNTSVSQVSWFARWAGILATMDVSAFIATILFRLTRTVKVEESVAPIRDKLSGVSYLILAVVFLIIIGGLGWCFYKALVAAGKSVELQSPDEVGDEGQQA